MAAKTLSSIEIASVISDVLDARLAGETWAVIDGRYRPVDPFAAAAVQEIEAVKAALLRAAQAKGGAKR